MNIPPPYQDLRTLSEHLCLSPRTIEMWVAQGRLPQPLDKAGKRIWEWRAVDRAMKRLIDDQKA